MPAQWSGSGPELLVTVDRAATTPLRGQIEDQLRTAIRAGRLAAGDPLPSTRALAAYLGLSRGVIQECYAQLQAEGYLASQGGSATRVAPLAASTRPVAPPVRAVVPAPTAALLADFACGVPDLAAAPREDWAWAIREVCRHAPNSAFGYADPRGDQQVREVVAAYLRRVRAVDTTADRVVVCNGFQQGLMLTLRCLARAGLTRVAFEDPGSLDTLPAAVSASGGQAVPVPVDGQGIDVAALDASGARVAVLTPAHQWPTGVVLAAERRHDLIAWARTRDAIIIEDDYDAEFRYDRTPVGSLQGLAPDRVVALGTVSKSLAPALRLGWAVLPESIAEEIADAKKVADRSAPGIDALALALLLESGRYDRHLRRMRAEYAHRRSALLAALDRHAPQMAVTGLAAGFHAVAHLPDTADEHAVIAQARSRGVGLSGMSSYRASGDLQPPQLVLGFGNTGTRAIHAGIQAIADLLRNG